MWHLWHKLFGWDYVMIEWACGYKICRVRKYPNGMEYVSIYGTYEVFSKTRREVIHLTRK